MEHVFKFTRIIIFEVITDKIFSKFCFTKLMAQWLIYLKPFVLIETIVYGLLKEFCQPVYFKTIN